MFDLSKIEIDEKILLEVSKPYLNNDYHGQSGVLINGVFCSMDDLDILSLFPKGIHDFSELSPYTVYNANSYLEAV